MWRLRQLLYLEQTDVRDASGTLIGTLIGTLSGRLRDAYRTLTVRLADACEGVWDAYKRSFRLRFKLQKFPSYWLSATYENDASDPSSLSPPLPFLDRRDASG